MAAEFATVSRRPVGTTPRTRILGPDEDPPSIADLVRLFPRMLLNPARHQRIGHRSRVVATSGERLVGLAAFERVEREIRVYDFAVVEEGDLSETDVAASLLSSLELACLASGGSRVVIAGSAAVNPRVLHGLGYRTINEGCAGCWLEKIIG